MSLTDDFGECPGAGGRLRRPLTGGELAIREDIEHATELSATDGWAEWLEATLNAVNFASLLTITPVLILDELVVCATEKRIVDNLMTRTLIFIATA